MAVLGVAPCTARIRRGSRTRLLEFCAWLCLQSKIQRLAWIVHVFVGVVPQEIDPMYRQQQQRRLDFANSFIDAVTIRPFFNGLRRMSRSSARVGRMPSAAAPAEASAAA